jgi:UDP-glucuronate decarboxylase
MHLRKRVLVTGGAGFLGSFLCERLLQEGCDVICCDNFYTGSKRNIAHLMSNPYFEVIRHDITFPIYLEVDEIFNLACPASPVHYQNDPVQTTKVNVHGAINMLGLAKRVRAKILQASTSEVYGDPAVHPQTESYWGNVNCIGPRSCYDEGKRCAETLFFDYHRQHRLNIRFKPLPADDPTQRRPDIGLAGQKLGWHPTVELEEGLRRTIDFFKEFLKAPRLLQELSRS